MGTKEKIKALAPDGKEIDKVFVGYSANLVAPRLEDWPNKDWTKTGYSCPAKGEVTTKGQFLNGIHARTLFAGEHTSMAFFGYMEGALQSGLRVASPNRWTEVEACALTRI